jgi:hypothetical protein
MGNFEISLVGQAPDERVGQTEGYIKVPGELPLARRAVFFDLFEKVQRSYVNRIHLL